MIAILFVQRLLRVIGVAKQIFSMDVKLVHDIQRLTYIGLNCHGWIMLNVVLTFDLMTRCYKTKLYVNEELTSYYTPCLALGLDIDEETNLYVSQNWSTVNPLRCMYCNGCSYRHNDYLNGDRFYNVVIVCQQWRLI